MRGSQEEGIIVTCVEITEIQLTNSCQQERIGRRGHYSFEMKPAGPLTVVSEVKLGKSDVLERGTIQAYLMAKL